MGIVELRTNDLCLYHLGNTVHILIGSACHQNLPRRALNRVLASGGLHCSFQSAQAENYAVGFKLNGRSATLSKADVRNAAKAYCDGNRAGKFVEASKISVMADNAVRCRTGIALERLPHRTEKLDHRSRSLRGLGHHRRRRLRAASSVSVMHRHRESSPITSATPLISSSASHVTKTRPALKYSIGSLALLRRALYLRTCRTR